MPIIVEHAQIDESSNGTETDSEDDIDVNNNYENKEDENNDCGNQIIENHNLYDNESESGEDQEAQQATQHTTGSRQSTRRYAARN